MVWSCNRQGRTSAKAAEGAGPLIKANSLDSYTAKDLAQMAKREGVAGWHSMRKEQLIKALSKLEKKSGKSVRKSRAKIGKTNGLQNGNSKQKTPIAEKKTPRRIREAHRLAGERKDISSISPNGDTDRIVLMVRDPYWLHAYWEIGNRSVIRAKAAMAEQWHTAKPVLRVLKSSAKSTTSAAEGVDRDIEIHGGVNNWFIDVNDPPMNFRVEIGYLAANGKFFAVSRSNSVTTPKSSSSDMSAQTWADMATNCDKILAQSGAFDQAGNDGELQRLFEERLKRPMGSPMITRFGVGAEAAIENERDFSVEVDTEMIVYGATQPDAHVMLGGEPVQINSDGTFTIRLSMQDGRKVLPVISSSGDGKQQQTVILAVERNTKTMEPVAREETQ